MILDHQPFLPARDPRVNAVSRADFLLADVDGHALRAIAHRPARPEAAGGQKHHVSTARRQGTEVRPPQGLANRKGFLLTLASSHLVYSCTTSDSRFGSPSAHDARPSRVSS